jgi:ABC-type nitrate/sulfonate/bicarbonate transport system permease component
VTTAVLGEELVEATATRTSPASGALAIAVRLLKPLASALVSMVIVILLWLAFVKGFNLNPLVAKSPADVWRFFIHGGAKGQPASRVWSGLGKTMEDSGIGLVSGLAAAIIVSVGFVLSRTVESALLPLAIVVRSVPIVAIVPLVALVFGRGLTCTAVISGTITFFPALVTMTYGLRSTSRLAADLCRAYGADGPTVVRKVMLPSALPAIFASARVAVPGALVGATLAEFFATGEGLGYQLFSDAQQFSYDSVWAGTAVLTLLSVLAYYVVAALENVVLARFGPSPARR